MKNLTLLSSVLFLLAQGCKSSFVLGDEHPVLGGGTGDPHSESGGSTGQPLSFGGSSAAGNGSAGSIALGGSAGTAGGASHGDTIMLGGAGTSAGTGGTLGGGAPVESGSAGAGGTVPGGAGGAISAGMGGTGAAESGGRTGKGRWLAARTSASTASQQSLLSLIDLTEPDRAPIFLESQSASYASFSPDGRWLIYQSYRGPTSTLFFAVNTSGDTPGQPELLFESSSTGAFAWSPDSNALSCIRQTGEGDAATQDVLGFDMSGPTAGRAEALGATPKRPFNDTNTQLHWVDADTVVFTNTLGTLDRVPWSNRFAFIPRNTDLPGGGFLQTSQDRSRGLMDTLDGKYLVDFKGLRRVPLSQHPHWSFAPSFQTALGSVDPVSDWSPMPRHYYVVSGLDLVGPVGQFDDNGLYGIFPALNNWSNRGDLRAEVQATQVDVASISAEGVSRETVPGLQGQPLNVSLSGDGQWVYVATQTSSPVAGALPVRQHWLSHVIGGKPERANSLGALETGVASFSPSSEFMVVYANDPGATEPAPFAARLYDLREPRGVVGYTLNRPLQWNRVIWSPDSSHFAVIGNSQPQPGSQLVVVDTRNAGAAPQLIFSCLDTAPGTCAESAEFQP